MNSLESPPSLKCTWVARAFTVGEDTFHNPGNLILISSVLLIYLLTFSATPTTVFWSPDEGAKFIQLHSLGWTGQQTGKLPYAGYQFDPVYNFYPHPLPPSHPFYAQSILYPSFGANGQVNFQWPIWFPLLSVFPFKLLGVPGLYLIPLLSGFLVTVLASWIVHRLLPAAALPALLAVGLGSPIFFYSLLFWEHTLAVLLGLAALWQAMQLRRSKLLAPLLTIVLLTGAVALRLEMLFYALALVLASGLALMIHHRPQLSSVITLSYWKKTSLLPSLIGVATGMLLYLVNPGWVGQNEKGLIEHGLQVLSDPHLLLFLPGRLRDVWINTPVELGPAMPSVLTWAGLVGVIGCGLAMQSQRRIQVGGLISGGFLVGLGSIYALYFAPSYRAIHSFLLPAPYLIFAFLILPFARQKKCFEVTLLALTTLFYLVLGTGAMVIGVDGGLEWGSRYLLLGYPLLGICAAIGICYFYQTSPAHGEKHLLSGLVSLLLLVGIQYEILGVQQLQTTKKDLLAYDHVLSTTHQPVVTDLYWFPAAMATRFVNQEMYTLADQADLSTWLNLAGGQVDSFLFVSLTPLEASALKTARYPLMLVEERVVNGLVFAKFNLIHTPKRAICS